jgi:hypothetical protein
MAVLTILMLLARMTRNRGQFALFEEHRAGRANTRLGRTDACRSIAVSCIELLSTSHHQHDTAVDRSGLEVGEYLVNVFQFRLADFRAHFALGGKRDCFGEIFAAAHN